MQVQNSNIELRDDNPYSLGQIFIFDEGDYQIDGPKITLASSPDDRYYTVSEGEDIWFISGEAYGNSRWYWALCQINGIMLATDLTEGMTLIIPTLERLKSLSPLT